MALLLAAMVASPLFAAPGDITAVPAPTLGSDPPKARDLGGGEANVSGQTGSFQYSYPINVPPGRMGMQPSLALSYSSQGAVYGGIASGWSIAIPEIHLDASESMIAQFPRPDLQNRYGTRIKYSSTLAGDSPLLAVNEPTATGVAATFRARHDSSYARYEQMALPSAYRWRVLTPEGKTLYFGDTDHAALSSNRWAPLTREVDSYGNTVDYYYYGPDILYITYTSTPGATPALPPFARVDFTWTPSAYCNGQPSGNLDDQRLKLNRGSRKLSQIRATAHAPGSSSTVHHTRQITLGYDAAGEQCTGLHAPVRMLTSIQESAWGDTEPMVTLPPATFQYNRLDRQFDQAVAQNTADLWDGLDGEPHNLGWGTRSPGKGWPTLNAMMLDFDGDGLQDRLVAGASGDECTVQWHKNQGRQADGSLLFLPQTPMTLPRLPWENGNSRTGAESCSLSAQYTKVQNVSVGQSSSCAANTGTYLAYRWMDLTGDGLPDLVTAIHHGMHYNPNLATPFGTWPSCEALQPMHCPALDSTTADDALTCGGNTDCVVDADILRSRVDVADKIPCGEMMRKVQAVVPSPECMGDCRDRTIGCGDWNTLCEANCTSACWDAYEVPPPPSPTGDIDCHLKGAQMRCEQYPWIIYENVGGSLSQTPRVKYQPLPLESDTGDSSFGGDGFSSNNHAIQDIDGDGELDAVTIGRSIKVPNSSTETRAVFWWLVFPGDGDGGFLEPPGGAHIWPVPLRAPVGASCTTTPDGTCAPRLFPIAQTDNFDVRGVSTLADLTGDGLADMTWKVDHSNYPLNAWWQTVGNSDPLQFYKSNGTGFDFYNFLYGTALNNPQQPDIEYLSRSSYDSDSYTTSPSGIFSTQGTRVSRSRLFDFDVDGRPDLLESGFGGNGIYQPLSLFTNSGTAFLSAPILSTTMRARLAQETKTFDSGGDYRWVSTKDVTDLDGDGLPESWQFDPVTETATMYRDTSNQPLRLMKTIANGRGATTTITYASTSDTNADVVSQDTANRTRPWYKALPTPQWVVSSVSTSDQWDPDVSTTSYHYSYPVWSEDPRGDWGFRGFEEVVTTSPSNARTEERYDYAVDWSGRLKTTLQFSAETPSSVHSIAETTWTSYTLFSGTLKTFHPTAKRSWECRNNQTEAACRATPSALQHTISQWVSMTDGGGGPQRLYVNTYNFIQDGEYTDSGDRYTYDGYILAASDGVYRLQRGTTALLQYVGTTPQWRNYQAWGFDAGNRHPVMHFQFIGVDGSGSPDIATGAMTTWTYLDTGVRQSERRPNQQPSGPQAVYGYDPTQRFVVSTTNQAGHITTASFEPGTGAQIYSEGPNRTSCGSGCTNAEAQWTDIDGLGRPIAVHVNRATGAAQWVKTKIAETIYTDSIVSGNPTKVVEKSLVSYGGAWTETESRLDGRGRTTASIVKTDTAQYATTTSNYDASGNLVSMTMPDPSLAAGATGNVTYTYTYDSLGRPTSMRRPAIGAQASGTDVIYDGVLSQHDEVAGSQGGPVGRKILINDPFGRLVEVREFTNLSSGAFSATFYQYDANNNVSRIQNADGVITDLNHDFASHRTSIVRAGRTWTYAYDRNGNLTSEVLPAPSPLSIAEHTNLYVYDDLDRVLSRSVGGRDYSPSDKSLLGIGSLSYSYDTPCTNGTGRLCGTSLPGGVLSLAYTYDEQGNQTSEAMTFNFGGVTGTRSTSTTYGPGGRVASNSYADDAIADPTKKTLAQFSYDVRGLPSQVNWVPASGGSARTIAQQTRNVAGLVTQRSALLAGIGQSWRSFNANLTYDKLGRVTSHSIASISPATTYASQVLTYRGLDDPATLVHTLDASTYSMAFDYSPRHELTSVTESTNKYAATFAHAPGGKLTAACVGTTAPCGSGTTTRNVTYEYTAGVDPEAPSALANVGASTKLRSYSYDSVGNQSQVRAGNTSAPVTDEFSYDGDDQLRRAKKFASGSLTGIEEYYYDNSGNRRAVVTRNASNAVTGVRVFIGESEIEFAANGSLTKAFAYVSLGTPVAKIVSPAGGWTSSSSSTAASVVELQYQGLANNTLLSVQPTGAVQSGFIYGPYGDVLQTSGGSVAGQHRRFNDKFQDDLTGLSYYGVRYYDPLLLTWTQADPMYRLVPDAAWSEPRRSSLYAFVLGNPVKYIDPDGRSATLTAGTVGCAAGPGGCAAGVAVGAVVDGVILVGGTAAVAYVASRIMPRMPWQGGGGEKLGPIFAAGSAAIAASVAATEAQSTDSASTSGSSAQATSSQGTATAADTTAAADTATTSATSSTRKGSGTIAPAGGSTHRKGARASTKKKHEQGEARRRRDRGGEKADVRRRLPTRRPKGHKGPWP